MNLSAKAITSHVLFYRDGETSTDPAGTASRTFRPNATDPKWIDAGIIEECSDNVSFGNEIEQWAPTPNTLQLWDIIRLKPKVVMKFTTSEFGPITAEMLYRTLKLDNTSTQFNPLEGDFSQKFWMKLQRYSHTNAVVASPTLLLDVFVSLKIDGDIAFGGGDLTKASFEATLLWSSLNTGNLGAS